VGDDDGGEQVKVSLYLNNWKSWESYTPYSVFHFQAYNVYSGNTELHFAVVVVLGIGSQCDSGPLYFLQSSVGSMMQWRSPAFKKRNPYADGACRI